MKAGKDTLAETGLQHVEWSGDEPFVVEVTGPLRTCQPERPERNHHENKTRIGINGRARDVH